MRQRNRCPVRVLPFPQIRTLTMLKSILSVPEGPLRADAFPSA